MNRNLKIGEKELEFNASAATPILYKKTFKKDVLLELDRITKLETKVEQGNEMNELVPELAFIMWAEAHMTKEEIFTKLNFEKYVEWLMDIEPDGLRNKSAEIIALYRGSMSTTSNSKN